MKRFGATTRLFAVVFIVFTKTGCGTLRNDRKWGQDAVYPVDLKKIPDAAYHAYSFDGTKREIAFVYFPGTITHIKESEKEDIASPKAFMA